ncbi:MAG: transglycosylase SLT domain-containing protein [Pseudomonadota bacterium]
MVAFVPRDIATWCAAYEAAPAVKRRAFWVGFLSSLAKYESTYREAAVGGGNRWFGLLQIAPSTARGYDCRARTGAALQDGAENLSCAIRILARTVPRDGVIHGYAGGKGLGVTADWAPMHKRVKRAEMASWLQAQSYCQSPATVRPRGRVLVD